mmetsp:Transcript_39680/g.75897  ORF Transcript_39680/g.75897 Transcript_39680/m.75897 type:complete len:233 (+) Transcript_39680:110-808(+)
MEVYTALIAGASRGIGLEFVRQLAPTMNVIATYRGATEPADLQTIRATYPSLRLEPLDVTDTAQVATLAKKLEGTPIDLLLLNAGIKGLSPQDLGSGIDVANMQHVFLTNTISQLKLAEAFQEHVKCSKRKQIVAMSSGLGSISDNTSGGSVAYRVSKAALNMAMQEVAVKLKDDGVHVLCMAPGWVRTDMGGSEARLTTEESVAGMLEVMNKREQLQTGGLYDFKGVHWQF